MINKEFIRNNMHKTTDENLSMYGKDVEEYLLGLCYNEIEEKLVENYIKVLTFKSRIKKINYTTKDIENIIKRTPIDFNEDKIYINRNFKVNSLQKDDAGKINELLKTNGELVYRDKNIFKDIVAQIIKIFVDLNKDIKDVDVAKYILELFARRCKSVLEINENDIKDIFDASEIKVEKNVYKILLEGLLKYINYHMELENVDHVGHVGYILIKDLCVRDGLKSIINYINRHFFNKNNDFVNIFKDIKIDECPIVRGLSGKLLTGVVYYSDVLGGYEECEEDFRKYVNVSDSSEESELDLTDLLSTLGIHEVDLDKKSGWTEK
jgi:hypothetical protein